MAGGGAGFVAACDIIIGFGFVVTGTMRCAYGVPFHMMNGPPLEGSSEYVSSCVGSGSSTIIPKEVEDVIVLHPAVAEVAVIGLPDAEWGEAVTAFVVTKPGMSVAEAELAEHCRTRLAGYKKPRSIRFVTSLPRSHYGKVLRAQLITQSME